MKENTADLLIGKARDSFSKIAHFMIEYDTFKNQNSSITELESK